MLFYIHQIRLKLIFTLLFLLHYRQQLTQVCFSSISMDSDYQNAVFVYVYRQQETPEILLFFP